MSRDDKFIEWQRLWWDSMPFYRMARGLAIESGPPDGRRGDPIPRPITR